MKALTIKEPFASLIKNKVKHVETRSFKTNYRGEIYIHAGISKDNLKRTDVMNLIDDSKLSFGNIICKCTLVDCVYMDEEFIKQIKKDKIEFICGNYQIGRYAWILDNVEEVKEIPIKGKLGIWNFN